VDAAGDRGQGRGCSCATASALHEATCNGSAAMNEVVSRALRLERLLANRERPTGGR
jgi:hypothetical protein